MDICTVLFLSFPMNLQFHWKSKNIIVFCQHYNTNVINLFLEKDGDNFESFIEKELNAECHLVAAESDDKVQLFVVIDNEVVIETDCYLSGFFVSLGHSMSST